MDRVVNGLSGILFLHFPNVNHSSNDEDILKIAAFIRVLPR